MIGSFLYTTWIVMITLVEIVGLLGGVVAALSLPMLLVYGLVRLSRRPVGRRLIPALVIAFVLSGGAISQAQIICTIPCPIWDFGAIAKSIAVNALQDGINGIIQQQAERLYKMAWRLQQFVPLARYVISPDDRPEWRIFDYFSGNNLYANPYLSALSYGDRSGAGFGAISVPRPGPVDVLTTTRGMSAEGRDVILKRVAVLDVQDSSIVRGTDEAGLIRYNGRASQLAIDTIQRDIVKDDNEESATAVLDKISTTRYLHLRDQQQRQQLLTEELELGLAENVAQREAAAEALNSFVIRKRDNGRTANSLVGGAGILTTWSQP